MPDSSAPGKDKNTLKRLLVNAFVMLLGAFTIIGTMSAMGGLYIKYKKWDTVEATCKTVYAHDEHKVVIGGCETRVEYEYKGKNYSQEFNDIFCRYKVAKECPRLVHPWFPGNSREPVRYWLLWLIMGAGAIMYVVGIRNAKKIDVPPNP